MHSVRRFAPWGLAALLVSSVGLQAQEAETNFSLDWKTRLGYSPSSKDNLRQSFLGFGMNLGYKIGPGKVGFELGYFYKTGDNFATQPDGSKLGAMQPIDPAHSIEDKRNELAGFTVRLSYQQDFSSKNLGWQAGIQLGAKFKHQYFADSRGQNYNLRDASGNTVDASGNPINVNTEWRDLYNGTPYKADLNPSVFAGIIWHVDKESSLEFNLLLLNYTAIDYHHYAGTASNYAGTTVTPTNGRVSDDYNHVSVMPYDKLETKNSMVPHIEVTYTFHF
jgi:hypothetical protein